jgi:hypothetical protein
VKPQDPAENEKTYNESQEQRRLERKIREEKRDLQMMKAQGAPEDAIAKQREKVKQTSADIDDFCKETGRARHRDREAVYTKREFPDKERYDVTEFERKQKELVEKYYQSGGEQQGFQFFTEDPETGERKTLTPKTPVTPAAPQTPAPVAPTPATPTPVAPVTPTPAEQTPQAVQTTQKPEDTELIKHLSKSSIEKRTVEALPSPLTQQEIIDKIGGADQTKGSCASVAWTYAGNKNGLDVTDYRGGASQIMFSNRKVSMMVGELDGVSSMVVKSKNDITGAKQLLATMQEGKEYFLATGQHASIVRKVGDKNEYLELQSAKNNGWHTLDESMLRWRFGCKKSHTFYGQRYEVANLLVDVDTLKGNQAFAQMLEYINTATDAQRKGIGGGIK